MAVYHHIEDNEGRMQALKELYRVLKPGGEAFITVWNRWQPRLLAQEKEHSCVPWKTKEKTLYRYYYLFSYRELEKLVRQAGFEVIKSFPESRYKFPLKNVFPEYLPAGEERHRNKSFFYFSASTHNLSPSVVKLIVPSVSVR